MSKALLKNQFLDLDPNYQQSKIHKYILYIFIDSKHLSLYLSLSRFFSSFHIISLGGFIVCRRSFFFLFLCYSYYTSGTRVLLLHSNQSLFHWRFDRIALHTHLFSYLLLTLYRPSLSPFPHSCLLPPPFSHSLCATYLIGTNQ